MHRQALRGTAQDYHGTGLANGFQAAGRGLQQRARPEEGQRFATLAELAGTVGLLQLGQRCAANDLHQIGWNTDRQVARTQHDHLGNGSGQRQHHAERRTLATGRGGLDASAQGVHFRAHHVHADATAGQASDLGCRGEALHEDELCGFVLAELRIGRNQSLGHRLGTNALNVQARAIITELDRNVVAFVAQRHRDGAGGGLAPGRAFLWHFDAMGNAVAQQVLERRRHAVQNAAIQLNGATCDIKLDLLAQLLGRLAHHGVQALGDALELDHACAQQIALQFAGLAALGDQVVLSAFQRTLQVALHGGHVVDRLGHHARELLNARETVKLQRIKARRTVLGQGQARLHLRLCLHLNVAQLLAQPLQVPGQIVQRTLDLLHTHIQARACDHHLARLVDQPVKQLGAHTNRLARGAALRCGLHRRPHADRRCQGRGLRCCRCRRFSDRCRLRRQRLRCRGLHGRLRLLPADDTQHLKTGLQAVKTGQQRLDLVGAQILGSDLLNRRLQAVRHFPQAHRACEPGTAFECMQCTQHHAARTHVLRVACPLAQRRAKRGEELRRFFLENRKQIGIDNVENVDIVVQIAATLHRLSDRIVQPTVRFQRRKGGLDCVGALANGLPGWHDIVHAVDGRHGLQGRHATADLCVQNVAQRIHELRLRRLQEACCELVQQPADVLRRSNKNLRLVRQAVGLQLHMLQRVLQQAGHLRQRGETHSGRAARQRMRQRHCLIGHRLVQLVRPAAQASLQAARPFISLTQIDVVERHANAQGANGLY